jgi:3-oxoadipate enol-lactonase
MARGRVRRGPSSTCPRFSAQNRAAGAAVSRPARLTIHYSYGRRRVLSTSREIQLNFSAGNASPDVDGRPEARYLGGALDVLLRWFATVRAAVRDPGYQTEVRIDGRGPAAVLIHGTPLDLREWDQLVPLLCSRWRIVRYDVRGHGAACSEPLPCSYDVLAADVRRLLDSLQIQRAHVLGHSFGGQIAVRFARDYSERVMSLTTICSRMTPFAPFVVVADQIRGGGFTQVAEAMMHRWFTAGALERELPVVRYSRMAFERANQASFETALRLISTFHGAVELRSLEAPVQIIAAERDQVVTAPDLRSAAAGLPAGSFSLVPGSGHMLPVEHPERLAALLATQTSE